MSKINIIKFMEKVNIRKNIMKKIKLLKEFILKINFKKYSKKTYLMSAVVGILALILIIIFISRNKIAQQNFSKGLITLNTNKSIYAPNEKVEIGLGSIDPKGNTLCHSNLSLEISGPSKIKILLSTENGKIANTCYEENNGANNSDYRTNFIPEKEGIYDMKLTNLDTKVSVENQIEVKSAQKFSLQRTGATRVNISKSNRYPMILTIKSMEDFKGQLVEQIPSSFDVVWQGASKVVITKAYKTVTWDVDIKAGEAEEFIYEYQAPSVSPGLFNFGKASLLQNKNKVFEDANLWKIITGGKIVGGNSNSDSPTTLIKTLPYIAFVNSLNLKK